MVSHSWIMECLDMIGAADAVKCLLGESMKTWRINLTANDECLGKVNIRRGIFQGDSLSPLLFVLALFPLSMILRKVSAGYEMKKDGCRINHLLFMHDLKLIMIRCLRRMRKRLIPWCRLCGSSAMTSAWSLVWRNVLRWPWRGVKGYIRMELLYPDGTQLRALGEEESYKYLGVLEADHVLHEESKERLKKE